MGKHGKKWQKADAEAPKAPVDLEEAIEFLKRQQTSKFDESMELAVLLGVDPKRSEMAVRGVAHLPHGTGKTVRVLVFAAGPAAEAARQAGADYVGFEDMIEKVKGGWTDFDVAVATPEAMQEVRKLGRVLGPRGLMPNPKTGTVTDDTQTAVEQSKAGKVDFRMDRQGNVHVPFGKKSFDKAQLIENAQAALTAIRAERPAGAKGAYIRRCSVTSTMGVGLRIDMRD